MKRILIVSAAMAAVMLLTGCSTTVTGIDVPESMTVEVGQAVDLAVNYTYKNENASDEKKAAAQSEAGVKLTSDSPAVTVAEDGTLTAAQGGEAIITVTSADGTLSDTCKVTVTVPLTGIALDQETLALAINGTESAKLTAAPVPAESTEPVDGVAYTSSNEAVATVAEDGTVTAVADGEAEITATLGEYTASCKVTVTTAPDGIKFGKASGSLTVGGSTTLKLYTTPSEAAAPDMSQVTFTSSDEDVATVDSEGKVTAKKAGKATITATYNGLTAEYSLTVNNKAAAPAGGSTAASGNGAAPSTNNGSSAPSTGGNTPSAGGSSGGTTPAPAPEQPAPAPDNGGSSGNDLPIINPGDEWDGSNAIIGGGGVFDSPDFDGPVIDR
ncbi:Ig-like domain-containing protein [Allofournierella massiliensis]|uniref:Ig-like protein group 2 n=1 Tax=Allofournierella massiliensis TaxID=1650663 RepID=A0A4R1QHM8_9FIRM|nr:Ig-like domain-containing protein [Fournierella massiliensis]TCL52597.1 Ig-like protein group 2 [Fournierella massiliensis]